MVTVILNGLFWKRTEIILSFFETAPKYCILDSFVDYEDYSISSKGFFPTIEDIMAICDQYRRQVQSLGWEYSLEKEMATHSSILA